MTLTDKQCFENNFSASFWLKFKVWRTCSLAAGTCKTRFLTVDWEAGQRVGGKQKKTSGPPIEPNLAFF